MQIGIVQSGPAVMKAMPLMQKTSIAPNEHFDLSEKMSGLISVKANFGYKMTGLGLMLDLYA